MEIRSIEKCKNIVFMCDSCLNRCNNIDKEESLNSKIDDIYKCIDNINVNMRQIITEQIRSIVSKSDGDEMAGPRKRKRSRIVSDSVFVGKKSVNITPTSTQKKSTTFADIVKNTDPKNCIVLKHKDGAGGEKSMFENLKEKVDPMGIGLKRVKCVSNGGVLVECCNKISLEKLKEEVNNKIGENVEIKSVNKFSVRMKLLGMSDDLQKSEIDEGLKKYNPSIRNLEFRTVFKYENRKKSFYKYNAIIESDVETFKKLIDLGTVTLGFDVCRIVPDYDIMRCFKCCGYNHKSETCKHKMACFRCGECHKFEECEKIGDEFVKPEKCVNCAKYCELTKEVLDIHHRAWSKDCFVHQRKLERQKNNVNSLLK
jgi:hypothetical protein